MTPLTLEEAAGFVIIAAVVVGIVWRAVKWVRCWRADWELRSYPRRSLKPARPQP